MATALLADQGADVVKIEAPGAGDLTRIVGARAGGLSAMFCTVNRGKRSMVVDLRAAVGLEVLHRLVARAERVRADFVPAWPSGWAWATRHSVR